MEDRHLFEAVDRASLLTAISMSEVSAKKSRLFSQLARGQEVRDFFEKRAFALGRVTARLQALLGAVSKTDEY